MFHCSKSSSFMSCKVAALMGAGRGLADRKVLELSTGMSGEKGGGGGNKSSSKKKRRRQKKQAPTAVQRLFETCKEVFSDCRPGVVPPPEDVERLRSVLDSMKPSDVNLDSSMSYFESDGSETGNAPITYMHLYGCDKFSICIFCLPPSGVIPLHNHPGMTVFSKLLFGKMHLKSFDWADTPQIFNNGVVPTEVQHPGLRLAKVKIDEDFTAPCNTSILYPTAGGNMHCFSATTACAVLDVLGPPYCDPEGRHCTYYNNFPFASFGGDMNNLPDYGEYFWLEERERKPDDFNVLGAKYMGPEIVDR